MHSVALLMLAAVHAASTSEVAQPTPLPGGFVDATGQIGIFTTPTGGIQAIELSTGTTRWQSNEAQRPLFVAENRLFALAAVRAPILHSFFFEWPAPWEGPRNGFRLVAFDLSQSGEVVVESETVPLPEWASIVEAHNRSCALAWHTEKGRLVLNYEAKTWYGGLIRKTPQEEETYRHNAAGIARFDLESGAFDLLPAQPSPAAPPPFEAGRELERKAIRWQKTTAKLHLALTLEETPGKQTLSLYTFDRATRQLLGVKPLLSGQRLTVLPTIDEQFLCLRDATPSPDLQAKDEHQVVHWSIFTAEGGQCLAEAPFEPGTTTAAIHGSRAYFLIAGRINGSMDRPFVVPRSLRAVDLKTGTTLWEQPVGGKPSSPPPLLSWPAPAANAG